MKVTQQSHDIPDGHNEEEQNPKCYISKVAPNIIESTAGNMKWSYGMICPCVSNPGFNKLALQVTWCGMIV